MWPLSACLLLSAVGVGSAQLVFSVTDVVKRTDCNKTVILPCFVTNTKENNINVMFVTWKKEGKQIFSFDGAKKEIFRDPAFLSANLVSQVDLPKGVASLMLNNTEAQVGNYSCEVTESNREGETRVELQDHPVVSCGEEDTPTPKEKCEALKYEIVSQKKMGIIIAAIIVLVVAVVGTVLFVQGGYSAQSQAGLGLIVVPAVILVLFQYLMFGIVFDSLSAATCALLCLQILGYIIAVVGFALCVSACPPSHGPVVIAALAIMAFANLLSLAYVFFMGSSTKDHPRPGKAVEEPLNELQSDVICEKYTVVDTQWP
ncbi:leukocyte surface antigen CD47 [Phalacrocorax aristotelis]|uniref:leukocyte surface antigen CD47 n=1 Tax=Phalacrocorax aristotelis TaxID=126867 RepID=UPI003F4B3826